MSRCHHQVIIPALLSSMAKDAQANPRVAAYAASAMLNILTYAQPHHLESVQHVPPPSGDSNLSLSSSFSPSPFCNRRRWIEPLHSTLIPLLMSGNLLLQQASLPNFAALSIAVPGWFLEAPPLRRWEFHGPSLIPSLRRFVASFQTSSRPNSTQQ